MKIKVKSVLYALDMTTPQELAVFLGRTKNTSYYWGEYMPKLAAYELLEKRPELRRLRED